MAEQNIDLLYTAFRFGFTVLLLLFVAAVAKATLIDAQLVVGDSVDQPNTMPGHASLLVINSAESSLSSGMTLRLPTRATVGRATASEITIDDPSVSARHAIIEQQNGVWRIYDLDSTNGTLVEGRHVSDITDLHGGEQIQFGDVLLQFVC